MTTIQLTLSDEHLQRVQALAQEVGMAPEELLRANIEAWLAQPQDRFEQAADYLLEKNRELYRRLA